MKKIFALTIALLGSTTLFAENTTNETSENESAAKSLFDRIFKTQTETEKFKVLLHTKGSFNIDMPHGKFEEAAFRMDQLRIDIKGDINSRIYYRYQQRLTNYPNYDNTVDNLPLKVDYAGVGFRFNDRLRMFAGKMCTAYGSIEFDDNPINVYQYSTIHENMLAFLTGVDFTYNLTPKHELRFQVLDGRNGTMEETYGKIPENIQASKADFLYTLNWNGKFGPDNMFNTRWSASVLNEAKSHNMYYFALGTMMTTPKFGTFLDLLYSREELDRKQIVSRIVADKTDGFTQTGTDYSGVILAMYYRITPQWNIIAKGIWDSASKYKTSGIVEKGTYENTFGYTAGIEYFPIKNDNLHINLVYTGRKHKYTDLARQFGAKSYTENKIELSFIYEMRIF